MIKMSIRNAQLNLIKNQLLTHCHNLHIQLAASFTQSIEMVEVSEHRLQFHMASQKGNLNIKTSGKIVVRWRSTKARNYHHKIT